MEEKTSREIWEKLFDLVWDKVDSPEDVKDIMNLINKYGELRIKDILEVTNG